MLNNFYKYIIHITSVSLLVALIYKFENRDKMIFDKKIKIFAESFFTNQNQISDEIRNLFLNDSTSKINLIEEFVTSNKFIDSAEFYVNVNNDFNLYYAEVKPIVRVFNSYNQSYYLNSKCKKIPLSKKYTTDVIVVSGFTENIKDEKIVNLVDEINSFHFLKHQISEIYISEENEIYLNTFLGDHEIKIGTFQDLTKKLNKTMIFYNKIIPKNGWNKYSKINLEYNNQIICLKDD